jgi:type I restriction enzyme S subunit
VGLAQLKNKQKGATKAGLGLDDIKTIEVPFPPIEEQNEIVRILDKLLDHEEEAKALIEMEE